MPTHRKLVPRKKFDKNGVLTTRNHAVDSKEFIQEKLSRKAELEKTLKASNDRVSGDGDTTEIKERDHETQLRVAAWEIEDIDAFLRVTENGRGYEGVQLQHKIEDLEIRIVQTGKTLREMGAQQEAVSPWNPVRRLWLARKADNLVAIQLNMWREQNAARDELSELPGYSEQ